MPITWYFRNTNASTGPTGELSTDTDSFPSVPSDKNTPKDMVLTKGSAQTSVAGAYVAATLKTMVRLFVGPALAAQTLTGSQAGYKVAVGAKESSTSMNLYMRTFVYVWRSGSGNVKTILVPTSCTVEHGTSEKGCVITATGATTDFAVLEGDRIVAEIWFDIRDTTTSYTATLYWDGTTDPVDGTTTSNAASYFYCPQTLNPSITAKSFSDVGHGSEGFLNPFRAMGFGETGHGTEAFNNPFRAMRFSDVGVGTDVFTQGNLTAGFTRLSFDSLTESTIHFHCPDCGEADHSKRYWFTPDRGSGVTYFAIPNHTSLDTSEQCVGSGKTIKLYVSTSSISRPDGLT